MHVPIHLASTTRSMCRSTCEEERKKNTSTTIGPSARQAGVIPRPCVTSSTALREREKGLQEDLLLNLDSTHVSEGWCFDGLNLGGGVGRVT